MELEGGVKSENSVSMRSTRSLLTESDGLAALAPATPPCAAADRTKTPCAASPRAASPRGHHRASQTVACAACCGGP
jgi:hypothetical protein